jgi:hypothetical protein
MSTAVTAPVWGNRDAILRSVWVATGESAEWIAQRTDALLQQLQSAFDVAYWRTSKDQRWEGSPDALADIVRGFVGTGIDGDPEPENGYVFSVAGAGPRVAPRIRVSAGSISTGGRLPSHHLTVELREMYSGAITAQDGDVVCAAVAQAWGPAMFALADDLVRKAARRGNWKIGIGYRTWISSEVGAVNQVADGLTATELAGGTLISAPDDWPAERVVAAMAETLSINGLDEVPH